MSRPVPLRKYGEMLRETPFSVPPLSALEASKTWLSPRGGTVSVCCRTENRAALAQDCRVATSERYDRNRRKMYRG